MTVCNDSISRKVIVTGASGFIGSRLIKELISCGYYVLAIIRPNSQNKDKIINIKNVKIIECDLKNISQLPYLIEPKNIDVFYHLAWEGSSGESRNDYKTQMQNVTYSVDCLKVACALNIKRFISIGTIAERLMENIDVMENISMSAMYSITKDYTHKLLNAISKQNHIEFVWCRLSNIYGPGDNTSNIINYTITHVLENKKTEYSIGNQPCNMLYIDDCIDALARIGNTQIINRHTYFIGGLEIRSVKYFVERTKYFINPDVKLGWGQRKNDGIIYKPEWLGTWEIQDDFGFMAKTDFDRGIQKTIEWKLNSQNIQA